MTDVTNKEPELVPQRIVQRTDRDCLQCCLSMVTGIPYEEIPDFCGDWDTCWAEHCSRWLEKRGWGLVVLDEVPGFLPHWLPLIAKGPTKRAAYHHCVVFHAGGMLDPHPSEAGLKEIVNRYIVIRRPSSLLSEAAVKKCAEEINEELEFIMVLGDESAKEMLGEIMSRHLLSAKPEEDKL